MTALTISAVKKQAKELARASGRSKGECLEAISQRVNNTNWHAFRRKLIGPRPEVAIDDRVYAFTPPDPGSGDDLENHLIVALMSGARNRFPEKHLLPLPRLLFADVCRSRKALVGEFAAMRYAFEVRRSIANWLDEVCSRDWRLDFVYSSEVVGDVWIPVLVFNKETNKSLVQRELIDEGLTSFRRSLVLRDTDIAVVRRAADFDLQDADADAEAVSGLIAMKVLESVTNIAGFTAVRPTIVGWDMIADDVNTDMQAMSNEMFFAYLARMQIVVDPEQIKSFFNETDMTAILDELTQARLRQILHLGEIATGNFENVSWDH